VFLFAQGLQEGEFPKLDKIEHSSAASARGIPGDHAAIAFWRSLNKHEACFKKGL